MNRYYYVDIANKAPFIESERWKTAIREEIDGIAKYVSLGYSEPSALFFTDIIQGYKEVEINVIITKIIKKEPVVLDFPIICEDYGQEYVKDVISGRIFKKAERQNNSTIEAIYDGPELCFKVVKQISSEEIAKLLKSLKEDDVARYKSKLNYLEDAVTRGYKKDLARYKNAANSTEDFIKTFQKKYNDSNSDPKNRK